MYKVDLMPITSARYAQNVWRMRCGQKINKNGKEFTLPNTVTCDFTKDGDDIRIIEGELASVKDGVRMYFEEGDDWIFSMYFPDLTKQVAAMVAASMPNKPRKKGRWVDAVV